MATLYWKSDRVLGGGIGIVAVILLILAVIDARPRTTIENVPGTTL